MPKITDITGVLVGHSTDSNERTGCTAIIFPDGAVPGVDVRGSAPGTREIELMRPTFKLSEINAIMLSGGSAYGLRTVDGALDYLAEAGIGYDAHGQIVPIVPAAIIFDLRPGRNPQLPTKEMGYDACKNASRQFEEGLVGAGTGASVGNVLGLDNAMKGGLACAGIELSNGVIVSALVVVNSLGDVINYNNGEIVAGARKPGTNEFADTYQVMLNGGWGRPSPESNTTLALVVTNAAFFKTEMCKIAMMAQNGIARSTRPAHTMYDGDVVFSASVGNLEADINIVGEAAAHAVSAAIVRAVTISNDL